MKELKATKSQRKQNARRITQEMVEKALSIKGRPLKTIDSALLSLYIQDDLNQQFYELLTRMGLDLHYNFMDLYNYYKDAELGYHVGVNGKTFDFVIWDCERTLPDWIMEQINMRNNL